MRFVMLDTGIAKIQNQILTSDTLDLTKYAIGSAANVTLATDASYVIDTVYSGTGNISVSIVDDNTIKIILSLTENQPSFMIGNIMLFTEDDTPILWATHDTQIEKIQSNLPSIIGTRHIFHFLLKMSGVGTVANLTINPSILTDIAQVTTESDLLGAGVAPYNTYYVANAFATGFPALVMKKADLSGWCGLKLPDFTSETFIDYIVYGGNLGTNDDGIGIYSTKTSDTLNFKRLLTDNNSGISVASLTNSLKLNLNISTLATLVVPDITNDTVLIYDADADVHKKISLTTLYAYSNSAGENLGSGPSDGSRVYSGKPTTNLQFRRLYSDTATSAIEITEETNRLKFVLRTDSLTAELPTFSDDYLMFYDVSYNGHKKVVLNTFLASAITASSKGTGADGLDIYDSRTVNNFNFKRLYTDSTMSGVSLTSATNKITVALDTASLTAVTTVTALTDYVIMYTAAGHKKIKVNDMVASGGGEANTVEFVGTAPDGETYFSSKNGTVLEFLRMKAGYGISITKETSDLKFDQKVPIRQTFTATDGQTNFTITGGYAVGYADVFYNGLKLINGTDVTVTSGTIIALTSGAEAGAILEFIGQK